MANEHDDAGTEPARQVKAETRMGMRMAPLAFCPIATRLMLRTVQTGERAQPIIVPPGSLLMLVPEPDGLQFLQAMGWAPRGGATLVGGKVAELGTDAH
jgi:hypothetical protein